LYTLRSTNPRYDLMELRAIEDWTLLKERRSKVPLILSGGLNPHNVGEAIAVARPYALDTASGTEAAPGRKDPEKLKAFFEAAAGVSAGLSR